MIDAADPSQDEGLSTPRGNAKRLRRLRGDLLVGLVVIGGGFVIARAMSHGGHHAKPTPVPTSSVSSSASLPTDAPRVSLSDLPVALPMPARLAVDPARCPAGIGCFTVHDVSMPVRDALQSAFPGAAIDDAKTVQLYLKGYGQALWYVQAHAWMDRDELTLELRARTRADVSRHSTMLIAAHAITRYEGPLLQYQVIVSVVRPANQPQSVGALERLAGDVRLLASS